MGTTNSNSRVGIRKRTQHCSPKKQIAEITTDWKPEVSHRATCVTQKPKLTEELRRRALIITKEPSARKPAMESGRSEVSQFPPGTVARSASVPGKHLTGNNSTILTPQILTAERVLTKCTVYICQTVFAVLDIL